MQILVWNEKLQKKKNLSAFYARLSQNIEKKTIVEDPLKNFFFNIC